MQPNGQYFTQIYANSVYALIRVCQGQFFAGFRFLLSKKKADSKAKTICPPLSFSEGAHWVAIRNML